MAGAADTTSFWDRRAAAWERRAEAIEQHLTSYGRHGIDALALAAGERVLDVGCGTGSGTVALAQRVGPGGSVVGVDLAPAMVAAARRRVEAEIGNVSFLVADAESAALSGFDAAYARFALALFADPVAGLANIGRALRPGGRIACLDWGPRQDNPWMTVPRLAVAQTLGIAPPVMTSEYDLPGALRRQHAVFDRAGFAGTDVRAVTGERRISDATVAEDITTLFEEGGGLSDTWPTLDRGTRDRCIDAVIAAIAPYRRSSGWSLPGCAVLAVASRPTS
jgi:ubiquinone/menaquinone biosynthesis C-methylase UbiE